MRQTRSRQHDRKCRLHSSQVKSVYFNHPSQGNSTNYYLILGLRDKAAPSTSQQIKKNPPKRVKNLATPSSIFIIVFSSFTGELCSRPIRGNDRPIGRMFPEHVERRFLDPEYSFAEYFELGSRRNIRPVKNGRMLFKNNFTRPLDFHFICLKFAVLSSFLLTWSLIDRQTETER